MVEEGTLCGQTNVAKLAGANASTTSVAEAYTNVYIKMAEGKICTACRYDVVTNYASLSTIAKEFFRNVAASYAAVMVINYNMAGFTDRQEAMSMINILWAMYAEGIKSLSDDKFRELLGVVA